jgi:hypothetical protein
MWLCAVMVLSAFVMSVGVSNDVEGKGDTGDVILAPSPIYIEVWAGPSHYPVSGWSLDGTPTFKWMFTEPWRSWQISLKRLDDNYNYPPLTGNLGEATYDLSPSLPTAKYSWVIFVEYSMGPGLWAWAGPFSGPNFWVDVTPPNPPVVTESECGATHSDTVPVVLPPWTTHTSPYFTWSNPGDIGSGVSNVMVSVAGWTLITSPWHPTYGTGQYAWTFGSIDGAGNWDGVGESILARIDVTPPNTPIITESHCGGSNVGWPAWTTHTSPYFTWSDPGDSGSGVSYYRVSVNGGGWSTVTSGWHPTYGSGQYMFDIQAIDGVGLISSEYRIYLKIDYTSPNMPVVTESHCGGSYPTMPAWVAHTSPYFTWSDPGDGGSGVSYYQVSVNSGGWSTVSSPWEPTYGTGSYAFDIRSVDSVGFISGNYRIYVRIDATLPIITDNQAGDDTWRNSAGTAYNIDFSDSTSLLNYAQYKITSSTGQSGTILKDWTNIFTGLSASTYTTNWQIDFNACQQGTNYVSVRVYDNAGNPLVMDDVFYLKKDTTGPMANAGPDQTKIQNELMIFNGSASTDNIGINNYTWTFTYNSTAVTLYGISPTFAFWTLGNYNVTLKATDYAGNWNTDTIAVSVYELGQSTIQLHAGWNLISFPMDQPTVNGVLIKRASDLANQTSSEMISLWNPLTQAYINYIPGFTLPTDPQNFAIGPNDAFFIFLSGDDVLEASGYRGIGQRSVELSTGWNLIGYHSMAEGDVEADWAWQVACEGLDDICYW